MEFLVKNIFSKSIYFEEWQDSPLLKKATIAKSLF